VERVTFHNPENGFCVLRVKARGHRDLVTTIGYTAMISAGEWITASGIWLNDRDHGRQFKAHFLKTSAPSTVEGIEKYLGSGMIRGIGRCLAAVAHPPEGGRSGASSEASGAPIPTTGGRTSSTGSRTWRSRRSGRRRATSV